MSMLDCLLACASIAGTEGTNESLDSAALDTLVEEARTKRTDALVVMHRGAIVREEYFGLPREPIELMSCTKSIVSLVVGILVDDGTIPSIDTPVAMWYPSWGADPRKRAITVGDLLGHTSGLRTKPTTEEIYASDDFVQLALDADLDADPGTKFLYNNKAVNLLAGVVEKAGGKKLDEVARERLFEPLGISDFGWTKDRAGNPHAMSGLQLHATDFAAIGQLVLQDGEWEGERIVSEAWLDLSFRPPHPELTTQCGLLWWLDAPTIACSFDQALLDQWTAAGGSKPLLAVGRELVGKRFTGERCVDSMRAALLTALAEVGKRDPTAVSSGWFDPEVNRIGVPFWRTEPGPVAAIRADGYLGNFLVLVPEHELVAVRQRRSPANPADAANGAYNFGDFARRVQALAPKPRPDKR